MLLFLGSLRCRSCSKDLGATGLLALLVALFHWKILLHPNEFHIPFDIHDFHYSLAHQIFSGLQEGTFPLWDPFAYGGMPLAGNIQAQLFYPPTLLCLKLSDWIYGAFPYRMLEYQLMAHYFVAAAGVYWLGRAFAMDRAPALLMACVYTFGGSFASQAQHLGMLNGAAWIPWVGYSLKRGYDTRRLVHAAGAGVALSLIVLAGFPAMMVAACFYTGLVGLGLLVGSCVRRDWRQARFVFIAFSIIVSFAGGLSAIQLLPAIELNRHSVASEHHRLVGLGGWPHDGLPTLLLPRLFGAGGSGYWGFEDFTQSYYYLGIAPLLLAVVCLLIAHRPLVFALFGASVLSIFWALGENFSISAWIWLAMPAVLKGGIYPFCARVFFDLSVAMLAGLGMQALLEDLSLRNQRRLRSLLRTAGIALVVLVAVAVLLYAKAAAYEYGSPQRGRLILMNQSLNGLIAFTLLASILLAWRLSDHLKKPALAWCFPLVTVVDLFSFGSGKSFNTMAGYSQSLLDRDHLDGRTQPLAKLKSDPDYRKGRFMRIESRTSGRVWCTASRLWELENTNGDDPLLLKDYQQFRMLNSEVEDNRRFVLKPSPVKLLDLMSIKYIVSSESLTGFQPAEGLRLIDNGPPEIYLNSTFLPRAYLVSEVIVEESREAVIKRLASDSYSPRTAVVVDRVEARKLGHRGLPLRAGVPNNGTAQIISYRSNEVVVAVDSSSDTVLVLSESYFPGWVAEIDGVGTEIVRANGFQRAVAVQRGNHRILFRYQPMSVRLGARISSGTLLILLTVCLATVKIQPLPKAGSSLGSGRYS